MGTETCHQGLRHPMSVQLKKSTHFSVDARLTRLLGETYRSSEATLKELVDNAWDADARNAWITLPAPITSQPILVRDDGTGMTSEEMRGEYLNIASDKRTRMGDRTQRHGRKVEGRKGIGKFAGLTIAGQMQVASVARDHENRATFLGQRAHDLQHLTHEFRVRGGGRLVAQRHVGTLCQCAIAAHCCWSTKRSKG